MALHRGHSGSVRGNGPVKRWAAIRNEEEKVMMRVIMRLLEQIAQRGCEICVLEVVQKV